MDDNAEAVEGARLEARSDKDMGEETPSLVRAVKAVTTSSLSSS